MKDKKKSTGDDSDASAQVQPIIEAAEEAAVGIIAEAEAKAAEYVEESRRRTEEIAGRQAQDMWALTDALIARAEAVKRQSDELLEALNQTKRGAAAAIEAAPTPDLISPPEAAAPPAPTRPMTPPPRENPSPTGSTPPPPAIPPPRKPAPTETVPMGRATPPPRRPPAPPAEPAPLPPSRPPVPPPAASSPPAPPGPPPAPQTPPPPPETSSAASRPSEGARLLATQMAVAGSSREEITGRLRDDFGIGDAESMVDSILGSG